MASFKLAALLALLPLGMAGNVNRFQGAPKLARRTGDAVFEQGISPAPTPKPRYVPVEIERRDAPNGYCGYFTYDGSPWSCAPPNDCSTSGGYFGCNPGLVLSTACRDYAVCASASNLGGRGTLCCASIQWPFCITGIKTVGRSTLTGYACGNNLLGGTQSLLLDLETSTIELESTPAITTPSPRPTTPTPTPDPIPAPAGPPIGPIVGGVVGGIAVIALIAFGIWFLCARKPRPTSDPPAPPMSPRPDLGMDAKTNPAVAQVQPYAPVSSPSGNISPGYSPLHSPPLSPRPPTYYGYGEDQHQNMAAAGYQEPKQATPVDTRRVSEVPAINPSGMGNNRAELA